LLSGFARVLDYFGTTAALRQLAILAILLLLAWLLAWRFEPKLEARVRAIENPNKKLLRVIVVLLRRTGWVFFIVLGSLALVAMQGFGWPGATYVVSTAVLLALAWIVIQLLAQMIRSSLLRRLLSVSIWIYFALLVLGINDEVGEALNAVGFTVGKLQISPLLIIKVVVLLGLLLWGAVALGNFTDRRLQKAEDLTPSLRVLIG
jgi:small-conductance mechanosensitive channel